MCGLELAAQAVLTMYTAARMHACTSIRRRYLYVRTWAQHL